MIALARRLAAIAVLSLCATSLVLAQAGKGIPAGRLGTPEELAAVIVFLASERASYISGTTVNVDGGLMKGII